MGAAKPKPGVLDNFRIHGRASCAKAIRNGWVAAMVSASLTALLAGVGLFKQPSDAKLDYFLDPWLFVDVGLLLVFAFFVYRKSRVASTILVIYFLAGRILLISELGAAASSGTLLAIVFFLFYVTAMRGTYIGHRAYRTPAAGAGSGEAA